MSAERFADGMSVDAVARPLARQIVEAAKWVRYAKARANAERTNESACRLHYCEMWLESLLAIARVLP